MTNKIVKVAFTSAGLDKLQTAMQDVAEKKDELGKGVTITFTMPDGDAIEAKLDALSEKIDSLKGSGADIPVVLTGADEVEAKLGAIGDSTKDLEGKGIDIPVVVGDEGAGSLAELKTSFDETAASIDTMTAAQDRLFEATPEVMAGQDALAQSVRNSALAWGELGAAETDAMAKEKVASDSEDDLAVKTEASGGALSKLGMNAKLAGIGLAAVGVYSIYSAGKFDEMATQLVTGAGESVKNLAMVKQGMLAISAQTATSAEDVESGMYLIESAGFHGAAGLDVLKAAAEGAKVGNASLASVANAVTSALNAYHLPASSATKVTNELIATVASGKMHMDDLATSIGNVLPVAAKAGLSLAQVGGALATMTMQGMSTRRASMNLANGIRALEAPGATASAEMKLLGLNANEVSKNLGKVGLTGTLDQLTEAILRNSKGGTVMATGFSAMTAPVKQFAEGILQGKETTADLTAEIKTLTPQQAALLNAFSKSASGATGLSSTFTGAMKAMMGGATGLQVALLLGGASAGTFAKNVKSVQDAADSSSKAVTGWALIQSDAAFREDQLKVSVKDMSISLGDALMPAVQSIVGPLARFSSIIASSSVYSKVFAVAIGLVVAAFVGTKAIDVFNDMSGAVKQLGGVFATSAVAADSDAVATDTAAESTEAFSLALLANPIGIIIIAIVALGIAIYELIVHVKAFRDFWIDAWNDISQPVEKAFDAVKAVIVGSFDSWWSKNGTEIEDVWNTLWHGIESGFKAVWDFLSGTSNSGMQQIYNVIKPALDVIETVFKVALSAYTMYFKDAFDIMAAIVKIAFAGFEATIKIGWDLIVGIFDVFLDLVTGHWSKAWTQLAQTASQIWNAIRAYLNSIWSAIDQLADQMLHNLLEMFATTWNAIKGSVEDTFNWFKNVFTDLWHDIASIWDNMWMDITSIWDSFYDRERTGLTSLWGDISNIFNDIKNVVSTVWDYVWSHVIEETIQSAQSVENHLDTFVSWIGQKFSNAGTWLIDAGKDLIQGLYNGASSMIADVGSWASKIGGDIVNAVKSFFGIHSPSTVFMGIGTNIMLGLLKGLVSNSPAAMVGKIFGGFDQALMGMLSKGFTTVADLPAKALATITSWASKVGATIAGVGKSIWNDLFGGGTGGGPSSGSMSAEAIAAMWTAQGGPAYAANNMAQIAYAESGDHPSIVQQGEPPGLTGYGLYQITPTSGITQGGQFGNLLNAVNNTRAAISLFHGSGYSPWTSDPVGASLAGPGRPTGYAAGGIINEMITGMGASGTRYMFGENGPELVTPMSGLGGGSAGGTTIVNVSMGIVTDPNATAQAIHQLLRRYKTKKGGGPLGLD